MICKLYCPIKIEEEIVFKRIDDKEYSESDAFAIQQHSFTQGVLMWVIHTKKTEQ